MRLKSFKDMFILNEMATIVRENGYRITIYPEPLGNPSFHLIFKNDWEVVLQIKDFKILEVKGKIPFTKNTFLPTNIRKDLDEILNLIRGKWTVWEFLVHTWNMNNPEYEIDFNLEIPKDNK